MIHRGSRGERGFRVLPHTADKAIEAWGRSLPDLFCAAAEGMFSQGEDLAAIPREQEWTIEVEADSGEELLHAWLSELLWVAERDEAVPCECEIRELSEGPWRLKGLARGGPPPSEARHTGAPVKAVTYHQLRIWQDEGLWHAHLVFDV